MDVRYDTMEGFAGLTEDGGGADEPAAAGARPVGVLRPSERIGCAVSVRPSARLIDVLVLMAASMWGGFHSVFVTGEDGRPVGVVSLTDVLRLFVAAGGDELPQ